jgi:hypothetical protein
MEMVFWDFAAARIVLLMTGKGRAELAAARHHMMSHPRYEVRKHGVALDLSERYLNLL